MQVVPLLFRARYDGSLGLQIHKDCCNPLPSIALVLIEPAICPLCHYRWLQATVPWSTYSVHCALHSMHTQMLHSQPPQKSNGKKKTIHVPMWSWADEAMSVPGIMLQWHRSWSQCRQISLSIDKQSKHCKIVCHTCYNFQAWCPE